MSERIKMIGARLGGGHAVSESAVEHEASRKTAHKWIGRHVAGGWAALADQSLAPAIIPMRSRRRSNICFWS